MTENTENKSLIAIEDIKVQALFTQRRGLKAVLESIKDATAGFVPDLETIKGRDDVAALAYRVSRSKTLLDKAGAGITEDWRKKTATVNKVRKEIAEFCDNLRDEIRQPLTEWEAKEKEAKDAVDAEIKAEEDRKEKERADALKKREEDLERREAAIKEHEAVLAANTTPEAEPATDEEEAALEEAVPRKTPDPAGTEKAVYDRSKISWVFYLMMKHMGDERFHPGRELLKEALNEEELKEARTIWKEERAKARGGRSGA